MAKATAGQALTAQILADLDGQGLDPDAREQELLRHAAACADKIERLEAVLAAEGLTWSDKHGVVLPSPLCAEIRATTAIMVRCLGGIAMEAKLTPAGKSEKHSRAGQASWAARKARDAGKQVGRLA